MPPTTSSGCPGCVTCVRARLFFCPAALLVALVVVSALTVTNRCTLIAVDWARAEFRMIKRLQ